MEAIPKLHRGQNMDQLNMLIDLKCTCFIHGAGVLILLKISFFFHDAVHEYEIIQSIVQ